MTRYVHAAIMRKECTSIQRDVLFCATRIGTVEIKVKTQDLLPCPRFAFKYQVTHLHTHSLTTSALIVATMTKFEMVNLSWYSTT